MDEQQIRQGGPDTFRAKAHGNSIPQIKLAALDKARELYGADAALRIEGLEEISTSWGDSEDGKFWTWVTIRCLNLPEEDR
jgi:hypothetical protein